MILISASDRPVKGHIGWTVIVPFDMPFGTLSIKLDRPDQRDRGEKNVMVEGSTRLLSLDYLLCFFNDVRGGKSVSIQ